MQLMANQAKLSVAVNMKEHDSTVTSKTSLTIEETSLLKQYLPIEDPSVFEDFDKNLLNDKIFRERIVSSIAIFTEVLFL